MKKIINSRLYNTDSAKLIANAYSSLPRNDFSYWEETLYRKRTGEFFLYGEGGPMSRYSVSCGQNEWSGGEKIIPLADDEARVWAEEHMDADDYLKLFPVTDESGVTNEIYYTLVSESLNYTDPDAYVSDLALSSIWDDPEDAPIPEERITLLRDIYTAAHRTVKDIAAEADLSVRQLALHFAIPQRTAENWSNECAECPVYTRLMMQEALGIFRR